MADTTTPLQRGPPWMQLLMLMSFNTALYVANAFLEKMFSSHDTAAVPLCRGHVDILPIVGMMTGASPLDQQTTASRPTPTPSPPAETPPTEAFAAFARNFHGPPSPSVSADPPIQHAPTSGSG